MWRAAVFALLLSACMPPGPVHLGVDPDFLWWSDHEAGDLGDWLRDGAGAAYVQNGSANVTSERARSGRYALVSQVDVAGAGAAQVRRISLDASRAENAAFFGAWFYLPAFVRPNSYWVFFALRTQADAALWDLKLAPNNEQFTLQLLHHDRGDVPPTRPVAISVGRWFLVQAEFSARGAASDVLRVWLDGTLAFEVTGTAVGGQSQAAPTWILGTVTDGLSPAPASIYIDDAFITRRRLSHDTPPFWRP